MDQESPQQVFTGMQKDIDRVLHQYVYSSDSEDIVEYAVDAYLPHEFDEGT